MEEYFDIKMGFGQIMSAKRLFCRPIGTVSPYGGEEPPAGKALALTEDRSVRHVDAFFGNAKVE
ncbi:MAG: hypothetical protein FJ122_13780 [Deltaproteobacteria bacterium]|nr:hypothetical protein [Deltaproteobacteria bacterium]